VLNRCLIQYPRISGLTHSIVYPFANSVGSESRINFIKCSEVNAVIDSLSNDLYGHRTPLYTFPVAVAVYDVRNQLSVGRRLFRVGPRAPSLRTPVKFLSGINPVARGRAPDHPTVDTARPPQRACRRCPSRPPRGGTLGRDDCANSSPRSTSQLVTAFTARLHVHHLDHHLGQTAPPSRGRRATCRHHPAYAGRRRVTALGSPSPSGHSAASSAPWARGTRVPRPRPPGPCHPGCETDPDTFPTTGAGACVDGLEHAECQFICRMVCRIFSS
jgi:hypothetical protein